MIKMQGIIYTKNLIFHLIELLDYFKSFVCFYDLIGIYNKPQISGLTNQIKSLFKMSL